MESFTDYHLPEKIICKLKYILSVSTMYGYVIENVLTMYLQITALF